MRFKILTAAMLSFLLSGCGDRGVLVWERLWSAISPMIDTSRRPLATGTDLNLTVGDFLKQCQEFPKQYQDACREPENRLQTLKDLVHAEVLRREAKIAILGSEAPRLKRGSVEEHRIIAEFLRQLKTTDLAVSDEEARRYYESHVNMFARYRITLRRILTLNPEDAALVENRLKKGESFAQVAREMSADRRTAVLGGLMVFETKSLHPSFEDAAMRAPLGQISSIMATTSGFNIILKESQEALSKTGFEVVRGAVVEHVQAERLNAWVEQRVRDRNVKLNIDRLLGLDLATARR